MAAGSLSLVYGFLYVLAIFIGIFHIRLMSTLFHFTACFLCCSFQKTILFQLMSKIWLNSLSLFLFKVTNTSDGAVMHDAQMHQDNMASQAGFGCYYWNSPATNWKLASANLSRHARSEVPLDPRTTVMDVLYDSFFSKTGQEIILAPF